MNGRIIMEHGTLESKILESITDGVVCLKMDGSEILYVNNQFCKMFGYEETELIGKPVSMLNNPQADIGPQKAVDMTVSEVYRLGKYEGMFNNIKKDGTTFWTKASIIKHLDEKYGEIIITVQKDLTNQIILQEKLTQSEEKYKSLIERTNTGYIIMNENVEVIEANDIFLKMIGLKTHSEINGKKLRSWVLNESIDKFDRAFEKVLMGQGIFDTEISFTNSNELIVEMSLDANILNNGTFRMFCLARDIGSRKAEEKKKYIKDQKKRDRLTQKISAFRQTVIKDY